MRIKKFNESNSDCSFNDFKDIMMDILDDVDNEHRFEETNSYYSCMIFLDSVNSHEPDLKYNYITNAIRFQYGDNNRKEFGRQHISMLDNIQFEESTFTIFNIVIIILVFEENPTTSSTMFDVYCIFNNKLSYFRHFFY